jgi:predicted permease
LLPVCFLLIAWILPCSIELKRVLVVEAGMPSAVLPIVLARHYGGDPGTALRVALGTSLLALVTLPLWISVGLALLGLAE